MARIALIDPIGRAVTTVEAVLGRSHDIVVRPRIHAPGDVELVIADLRPAELADQATLRALASFGPVLLLVDRHQPIPPAVEESADVVVLRKPFDAFELRLLVDRLLEVAGGGPYERRVQQLRPVPLGHDHEDAVWLEFPFVPAPAGAVLRRGARLTAPLWILGEQGCGRRRVALAVCGVSRPSPRAVTLFSDERLEEVLLREHGGEPYALIVPEIENRSLVEQERLASILAGPREFRLICTSIDDPADRVLAGQFSRSLYQHLIGLAVQVPPLRERPITIPPLVQALSRSIMRSMGSSGEISFSPDAMARLQTYMWPGNVVELESVLVRTLTMVGEVDAGGRTIEAAELLFTPDGALMSPPVSKTGGEISRLPVQHESERRASAEAPRRPTLAVGDLGELPGRKVDEARDAAAVDDADDADDGTRDEQPETLEQFVAGLAHDLRNPMVAIKSFATFLERDEAAGGSAHELSKQASLACDRIGSYLDSLQEFATFGKPDPASIDLLDTLRGILRELDPEQARCVWVEGDGDATVVGDRDQLRFVMDNLLGASLAEISGEATVRVYTTPGREVPRVGTGAEGAPVQTGPSALVFEVASATGAAAKLRKFVRSEDGTPSWRVLLARMLAERNGCEVDVEFAAEALKIRCLLPGGEERTRGEQTNRSNS